MNYAVACLHATQSIGDLHFADVVTFAVEIVDLILSQSWELLCSYIQ
jgi:hypothetical protein